MPTTEYDNTTVAQDRLFQYLARQIRLVMQLTRPPPGTQSDAAIRLVIAETLRPILGQMMMADNLPSRRPEEESKETLSASPSNNCTVRVVPVQRQLQRLGVDTPEEATSEWSARCEAFSESELQSSLGDNDSDCDDRTEDGNNATIEFGTYPKQSLAWFRESSFEETFRKLKPADQKDPELFRNRLNEEIRIILTTAEYYHRSDPCDWDYLEE